MSPMNQGHSGGQSYHRDRGGSESLSPIPSPYNFVPLSNFVYFPTWADQVSQDVPFSDGICGSLEIEVTAKTPIYIRNGGNFDEDTKKRNQDPNYQDFFSILDHRYTIPGTSFKGMLRNIVEIISFSKIRVDDNRYSIRDLYFKKYTGEITEQTRSGYRSKALAGWLQLEGEDWVLIPCEYGRVEQSELENYRDIHIGIRRESAKDKYRAWGEDNLQIKFDIDTEEKPYSHSCGNLLYRKATNIGSGRTSGTLVFTGQPMPRGRPRTKHLEFIFFDPSRERIPVNHLQKDFEFIHSDPKDKNKPNEEWGYWKPQLQAGGQVPVFYLEKPDGSVASMGLAMMYRLPYQYSIAEAVEHTSPKHRDSTRHDLAELMFGYVSEHGKTTSALRGRVQVGHLQMVQTPGIDSKTLSESLVTTVLGGPKPTYYPNYIEQKINTQGNITTNEYTTFMDSDCRIRGWKRYAVRKDGESPNPSEPPTVKDKENLDVATTFRPLKAGTQFRGKIRVHNLRPIELGALIWALTWGGNPSLRHIVGMAKPYGYGAIQVTIIGSSLKNASSQTVDIARITRTMTEFEQAMEHENHDWKKSDQIRELQAMANPNSNPPMDNTEYPSLRKNKFVEYKKGKKALRPYSGIPASSGPGIPASSGPAFSSSASQTHHVNGEQVKCVALEEKTKKGGWKFQIQGEGPDGNGSLHPSANIPPDIAVGKVYPMIIFSARSGSHIFKWPDTSH